MSTFLDQNPNDPHARGRQDYLDGKKLKDCPFPSWKDGQKWRRGWMFQRGEEEQNARPDQ